MKYLFLFLAFLTAGCSKKNDHNEKGCVYGISKSTGEREYIKCSYRQMYGAGYNQAAADAIAEKYGIPKENVSSMANYSNWEFILNEGCNCQ